MPSALQQAGSQSPKPTRWAPLWTNRWFTGLWTQRSPLRDAATPFLYEKFYSGSRFDSLLDGGNVEISTRLTLVRSPGSSVYNSQNFGAVNQFKSFSYTNGGTEFIQVIADVAAGGIYNATGPSTKTLIVNTPGNGLNPMVSVNSDVFGDAVLLIKGIGWGLANAPNSAVVYVPYPAPAVYPWGIQTAFPFNIPPVVGGFFPSFSAAAGSLSPTAGYMWGYSFYNSTTGDVSNCSLLSVSSGAQTNKEFNLSFPLDIAGATCPTTAQADQIIIWRTLDGGSTLFFLATIPNPGPLAGPATYTDNNPDTSLNQFQQAAVNLENTNLLVYNVPNAKRSHDMAFHLDLVWVALENELYYSRTASAVLGNYYSGFPPLQKFKFPSTIEKLVPTANGLLVFTISDVYIVLGSNTSADPLYPVPMFPGYGVSSPLAVTLDGSIIYMYTTDSELLSIDPKAGFSEIGFPVGDILPAFASPTNACLTYHRQGSGDKALYLTSLALGSWYRMAASSPPETGFIWSPRRTVNGGSPNAVVQSIEVAPGIRNLLISDTLHGTILKRDSSTYTDNGNGYSSFAIVGSVVLAQPGQMAEMLFLAIDARKTSPAYVAPTVSMSFDEPFAYIPGSAALFYALPLNVPDPPELPASLTSFGQRYYFSQSNAPAWCRSIQVRFDWPNSTINTVGDELLSYTLVGAHWQES